MLPNTQPALVLVLASTALVQCARPATAILVVVDTDLAGADPSRASPPYRATLRAWVQEMGRPERSELRADGNGRRPLRWPASFTLVRREGASVEQRVRLELLLEATPLPSGERVSISRPAVLRFTEGVTTMARVILPIACAQAAEGCATPGVSCTAWQRCAEQGRACGLGGACVDVEVPTVALDRDAEQARGDAVAQLDAGVETIDVAVDGATDTGALDTGVDTGVCVASCAGRACGSDRCGGSCGACSGATPVCDDPAGRCVTGCAASQIRCGGSCVDPARDPLNCGGCGLMPVESCNRVDDNCNGRVDEGIAPEFVSVARTTDVDPSCLDAARSSLVCARGADRFCRARRCNVGGWGVAGPAASAATVLCVVDAVSMDAPFAELRAHDVDCDGSAGPGMHHESCLFAADAWCRAAPRRHAAGFGTVDATSAHGRVLCIPSDAGSLRVADVSIGTLTAREPGCTIDRRFGPDCFQAIHELCRARGYQGGFGPVRVTLARSTVDYVCVR